MMDTVLELTQKERAAISLFAEGRRHTDVASELDLTGENLDEVVISVLNKLFAGSLLNAVEDEVQDFTLEKDSPFEPAFSFEVEERELVSA